jgi:hypothetical protein
MSKFSRRLFISSAAIIMLLSFLPAVSASSLSFVPTAYIGTMNCPTPVCSTNWSGYAVTGPSGSVSFVNGSWIVPKASCTSATTYSSFWVGIDGYSSSTVEQTGTDSDCSSGTAHYYAWYEFYPAASAQISGFAVSPGDIITASVTYNGGSSFTTSIKDVTKGETFSTSGSVSNAARSSAEWIVERPEVCMGLHCKLTSLTNFGTSYLGYDYTSLSGTNYATISSALGSIGSFSSSSIHQITMVDNSGKVLAEPSALSSDGSSFTDTWHASS